MRAVRGAVGKLAHNLARGRHAGKMCQADDQHFGGGAGMRCRCHFGMTFQQHLPSAAKAGNALFCQRGNRGLLGIEKLFERAAGSLQAGAMHQVQKIGDDHFRLGAICHGRCQCGKPGGAIPGHGAGQDGDGITPAGTSQHLGDAVGGQAVSGHRRRLIEKRQRVADRALGGAGDGGDRLGLGSNGFALADRAQMSGKRLRRYPPQVKPLAARQDGDRNLADLGRGEDEFHIVGRFLKRLQQRVEGALGHHVDLVDDVDLEPCRDRAVANTLDDLARIIDTCMRSGIDLQNIDMPGGRDGPARLADTAWLQRCFAIAVRADAIQPTRQKTGG